MTEQLREAQNVVMVEGIVNENRLDFRNISSGKAIGGDLLVQVDESNIVAVNFFASEKKRDGGKNKIYESLLTVKDDFKSVAKHGVEDADRVRINSGRLEANEFYAASGNLISTFRVRSNFINRVTGDFIPGVSFQVETYLQGITEELVENEVTGRLVVKGIVPMYGGRISLLTFFVEDENGIKYIQDNYSVGDTVKLAGFINNDVQKVEKTEEMEFGGDLVNTYQKVKRELIVTRGSKPYEENGFDSDLIKQALADREAELKNLKEKAMQTSTTGAQGGGFGRRKDVPF